MDATKSSDPSTIVSFQHASGSDVSWTLQHTILMWRTTFFLLVGPFDNAVLNN